MRDTILGYENNLAKQKAYFDERLVKADGTIRQQSKLIDHIFTQIYGLAKNKKLIDKLFKNRKDNLSHKVKAT